MGLAVLGTLRTGVDMQSPEHHHHTAIAVLSSKPPPPFTLDPTWPARAWLMEVYTAQHTRWRNGEGFAKDFNQLAVASPPTDSGVIDLKMEATEVRLAALATGVSVCPCISGPCSSEPWNKGGGITGCIYVSQG